MVVCIDHDQTRSARRDERLDRPPKLHTHSERESTIPRERDQSPRREHDGGKATSSSTAPVDGKPHSPVNGKLPAIDHRASQNGSSGNAAPETTSSIKTPTYQQRSHGPPLTRHHRPIPPSLNRNAFNKPYARAATTGSNSEPLTARRGFEIPPTLASSVTAPIFSSRPDTLNAPLQDKDYIISQYPELKTLIKPVWIDNPKAPVANFLTGGKGGANGLGPRGPAYRIASGRLGGKPMTRCAISKRLSYASIAQSLLCPL